MKGRALQKLCCVLRICEEDPSRIWQFIKRPATAQHLGGKSKKKVRKKEEKEKRRTGEDLEIYKKAGDSSTFGRKKEENHTF